MDVLFPEIENFEMILLDLLYSINDRNRCFYLILFNIILLISRFPIIVLVTLPTDSVGPLTG